MKIATLILTLAWAMSTVAAPVPTEHHRAQAPTLTRRKIVGADEDWFYFGSQNGLSLQQIADLQRTQDGGDEGTPNPKQERPPSGQPGQSPPPAKSRTMSLEEYNESISQIMKKGAKRQEAEDFMLQQFGPPPAGNSKKPTQKMPSSDSKTPPQQKSLNAGKKGGSGSGVVKLTPEEYDQTVKQLRKSGASEAQAKAFIAKNLGVTQGVASQKPTKPVPDQGNKVPPKENVQRSDSKGGHGAKGVTQAQKDEFLANAQKNYGMTPKQAQKFLDETLAQKAKAESGK